jgi:hypothetical protein
MNINKATVARIRPVSWKVCVQGEQEVNYVRRLLDASQISCSDPICEPELQDPPVYSFIATPKFTSPITAPELQNILEADSNVEVAFDA